MTWFLVVIIYNASLPTTSFTVPMKDEQACMRAIHETQDRGTRLGNVSAHCVNSQTGDIKG